MNLSNHNSGSNIDIKNSGRHWSSANPMLPNGEIFIYISFKNRCRIIIAWVSNCYKTWFKLAEDCTKIATIKKPLKIKIHREQSEYELISEAGCSWSRISQFGIQVKVAWHSRRSRQENHQLFIPTWKGFHYNTLYSKNTNHAFSPTTKPAIFRTHSLAAQYREEYWERMKTKRSISQDIYTWAENDNRDRRARSWGATQQLHAFLVSCLVVFRIPTGGVKRKQVFVRDVLWNIVVWSQKDL